MLQLLLRPLLTRLPELALMAAILVLCLLTANWFNFTFHHQHWHAKQRLEQKYQLNIVKLTTEAVNQETKRRLSSFNSSFTPTVEELKKSAR